MAKSFHELSQRAQLIVFGLMCVLAAAGAWQVSIGPGSAELETRRAHLAKLESEIVRVQAIADKLPALQREVRSLQVALRETTASIPEEKDPQEVLASLLRSGGRVVARPGGLEASQRSSTRRSTSEWPIAADVRGRLPRPRPVLRSARGDVAADFGVGSQHQDQDQAQWARQRPGDLCGDHVRVPPGSGRRPADANVRKGRPAMTVMTRAIRFTMGASVLATDGGDAVDTQRPRFRSAPRSARRRLRHPRASALTTALAAATRSSRSSRRVALRLAQSRRRDRRHGLGSFLLADVTVTGLVRFGKRDDRHHPGRRQDELRREAGQQAR